DASDADAQAIRDLTGLLWASIDNDDSPDLDQLTVAETLPGDPFRIRVSIPDVDALVKDGSAIDAHARHNTTSVSAHAETMDRIVHLAQAHGVRLPANADSVALDAFLVKERAADPLRFADLSLAVIKLLGRR